MVNFEIYLSKFKNNKFLIENKNQINKFVSFTHTQFHPFKLESKITLKKLGNLFLNFKKLVQFKNALN